MAEVSLENFHWFLQGLYFHVIACKLQLLYNVEI